MTVTNYMKLTRPIPAQAGMNRMMNRPILPWMADPRTGGKYSSCWVADPRTGGDEPLFVFILVILVTRSPHRRGRAAFKHAAWRVDAPIPGRGEDEPPCPVISGSPNVRSLYSRRYHHNGALIVKYGEEESVQK